MAGPPRPTNAVLERIATPGDLATRYGIARSTLAGWQRDPTFPDPLRAGGRGHETWYWQPETDTWVTLNRPAIIIDATSARHS